MPTYTPIHIYHTSIHTTRLIPYPPILSPHHTIPYHTIPCQTIHIWELRTSLQGIDFRDDPKISAFLFDIFYLPRAMEKIHHLEMCYLLKIRIFVHCHVSFSGVQMFPQLVPIGNERWFLIICQPFLAPNPHQKKQPNPTRNPKARWWQLNYFLEMFTPKMGEKWSNLTSICFKWVGSTTN